MSAYQYFKLLAKIRLDIRGGLTDLTPAWLSAKYGVPVEVINVALDKLTKEGILVSVDEQNR